MIDLESLSIEADIPRVLGQFAAILITISVISNVCFVLVYGGVFDLPAFCASHRHRQSLLASTMLIAGLTAVATWDTLPRSARHHATRCRSLRPRTILAAKLASSGSLFAIGVLSLNCGISIVLPLVAGGLLHFPLITAAYLLTVSAAAIFVFGVLLTIQGLLLQFCRDDGSCGFRQYYTRQFCAVPIGVAISTELW